MLKNLNRFKKFHQLLIFLKNVKIKFSDLGLISFRFFFS